jgi:lipoic acid synthetase
VITSVDRDDLRDGGAAHFAACIRATREHSPGTRIEVLVPDFRGRLAQALDALSAAAPDVMNHNLETVPRLYRQARPGADYQHSLQLLQQFKARHPSIPTKSGLMLGLGETDEEIVSVMQDLRRHDVDMLTIGQYLQPSPHHLSVARYAHPDVFAALERDARRLGFSHAAVGPMVRSSYHADQQAFAAGIG